MRLKLISTLSCKLRMTFICLSLALMHVAQSASYGEGIGPSNSFGRTTTVHFSADDLSGVLHQAGRQIAQVAAKTRASVVHIESERRQSNSITEETGSGVLMTDPRVQGVFVVTNRHVVADAALSDISIRLSDARVINPYDKIEDPSSDLAVLRVRDPGITPASWGDSDNLDIGHFVLAVGSPFGLNQSVTLGIISAKGRRALDLPGSRVINQDFLQTDAAINPGNSGGPLIDLNGRVVGINTAIASQGGGNEGIGFSIPSNLVQFVAIQLLEHGRVRRGYLGVELDENFDLETAKRFSLDRLFGARVTRVLDSTPAARAGLRRDDIIISFDGMDIEDENDLINRVSLTPVNKEVRMIVVRGGRKISLSVNLAERERLQSARPVRELIPTRPSSFKKTSLKTVQVDQNIAHQLGLESAQTGVMVMQVPQSLQNSGLQLYDVIEEVGRKPVDTPKALEDQLRKLGDAPKVVKILRVVEGHPVSQLIVIN